MRARARIALVNDRDEPFMGIGLVWLLERVARLRSINKAAADMRMSYVKALRILKGLETNLGRKVLVRTRGGSRRGGAALTPFGEAFVARYAAFQERAAGLVDREFAVFRRGLSRDARAGGSR